MEPEIHPLVSVIVPAYNVSSYLSQAVASALAQTWTHLEVIIVDDGSTDDTSRLADGLAAANGRVRTLHKANGGLCSARNAGLAAARGAFVNFLDADDVLWPTKVAHQLTWFRQCTGCDGVYSDHYVGDEAASPLWLESRAPPPIPFEELLSYRNWFSPFSPLLRTDLLRRVGGFDESLTSVEDWDYWIRVSRAGRLVYAPGIAGVYRTHPGQMHRNMERMRLNQKVVTGKNFAIGSPQWRNATSSSAWREAKLRLSHGEWLGGMGALLRYLWSARSPGRMWRVIKYRE